MQLKIAKILKDDITSTFAFPVYYVDDEGVTHDFTVFSNEQFRQIVKQLFGARVYNDWEDETTEQQCRSDFVASFNAWKGIRSDTYGRRMYALSVKFNPLENYRSHEEREGSFTHGEEVELSFTNRKDITKDDTYVEKSYTNYKESEKDDSFVERTYNNLKDKTTDDSYVEKSYTNYKESTKDDSYIERTHTNLKETTTDDTYVERSYTNFKDTTKDDSTLTRSYNQYKESTTYGEQTATNKISADDASTFVNSSQTINAQHTDDKEFSGSYTDEHGYDTNGLVKETSGSYKDQHGQTFTGVEKTTTGSYKDQHGFDTLGNEKSITGTIKDQHGQTLNGVEKTTSGSYTDQHGFDTIGNEKTITGSIKDQKGFTNGVVDEKTGTETTTHSGTDEDGYTLERYGNIGVTTSQQMLASDLDLLKYDITMTAIKEFIQTYTYFSLEVD